MAQIQDSEQAANQERGDQDSRQQSKAPEYLPFPGAFRRCISHRASPFFLRRPQSIERRWCIHGVRAFLWPGQMRRDAPPRALKRERILDPLILIICLEISDQAPLL